MLLQKSALPQNVPALHEQCHDQPDAREVCQGSCFRHRLCGMGDVDQVIERSARQISSRQQVEGLSWETGEVSGQDCGSKETEILEPIYLCTLAAVDHCLGLRTHSVEIDVVQ
jgi:hypothetical protein